MQTAENIFCLARTDLDAGGFLRGGRVDLAALLALPHHFIPRPAAEDDPDFKQIIPYQVFCCGDKFFVFRRGGGVGEQRLSGRLSIGIGGHINNRDSEAGVMTPAAFERALLRERREELVLSGPVTSTFFGLINDDSDAVGRVHLGAVFLCRVGNENHLTLGDEEDLHLEGWWPPEEVERQQERFEKWSLLALGLISGDSSGHDVRPRS